MGIVSVGTAQGAGVRPQDRAHHPAVGHLQDVRAKYFLRGAVISTEDADFGLLLAPGSRFAHFPLHAKQVETRKAPSKTHIPLRELDAELVMEGPQDGEGLFQIQEGGRRGASGRAAALEVPSLSSATDDARTRRRVIQTQGGFQRLSDGVGIWMQTQLIALRNQSRQSKIVIPEIKSVVIRAARI